MSAIDLCVFLTSYSLVVAFAAVGELFRSRRASSLISVVVALAAISASTVVGFYLEPGESYFEILWFLVGERDMSAVASAGLGIAAAMVWVMRLFGPSRATGDDVRRRWVQYGFAQIVLAGSILGVVLCSQAFIWKEIRGIQREPAVRMHASGFIIEKIADLDYPPIRVATDDAGKVYVTYDYLEDMGTIGGGIVELSRNDADGKFQQRIVATSPLLLKCFGLAARNGSLFVSRSGTLARANQGKISYENAGSVTQLRDIDGDGYYEFAHDVVTGLPGSRGPETMHQNNGIAFAEDGSLFVACASSGDRTLDEHPWGGTVLRVSPDFATTEVFARGFRNPFGIALGPDEELFLNDNDIDANAGDEFNHIVENEHYGHPFVVPNEPSIIAEGFREPVLVGEHEWNFLGMAYATSPSIPEEYRNCMYIADFMQRAIWRLKLQKSGDTYKVTSIDKFASIPSPIDIAVNSSGEFFVISRNTKKVYCIRPRRTRAGGTDE